MRTALLAAGLAMAGLALVAGPARADRHTMEESSGRLDPPDIETAVQSDAVGRFTLRVFTGQDFFREEFHLSARGLDATPDENGVRPEYHAFAVTNNLITGIPQPTRVEVDFGPVRLSVKGVARLRLKRPQDFFPPSVTSMKDFVGGTVELREGRTILLTGPVSAFAERMEGAETGPRSLGTSRLVATPAGGGARGRITTAFAPARGGDFEAVHIACDTLGESGSTFRVVLIDGTGNETSLGTFVTRSVFGDRTYRSNSVGRFDRSTDDEFTFPGGGVRSMSGWTVEIRDTEGTAWLTGPFPDFPDPIGGR